MHAFLRGLARIFDFMGALNRPITRDLPAYYCCDDLSDEEKTARDWEMIGKDMWTAFNRIEAEIQEERNHHG